MPVGKIQDEGEVIRWINEGRTYQWIVDEYLRKYNIETTIAMWGNFRRRKMLDKRIVRDADLIPWSFNPEHRWAYPLTMLRVEARRRAGVEVKGADLERLLPWLEALKRDNLVVHYDPDTEDGFFYIPRQESDTDIIRMPPKNQRRKA